METPFNTTNDSIIAISSLFKTISTHINVSISKNHVEDTARTQREIKWVSVNTQAHLLFLRQQDSLQKID